MAKNYSLFKRVVQAVPGLRESLATAFTLLPKPLSSKAYALLRQHVSRDNEPRLKVFNLAFEQIKKRVCSTLTTLSLVSRVVPVSLQVT